MATTSGEKGLAAVLLGALAVAALAIAGVFVGAAALERLATPKHPCPSCGKPVAQGASPCPSCGTDLRWESR
jgi:rubrerythrin